jgi:uncharacterized membrane protein (DUF485 family)
MDKRVKAKFHIVNAIILLAIYFIICINMAILGSQFLATIVVVESFLYIFGITGIAILAIICWCLGLLAGLDIIEKNLKTLK